MITEHQCQNWAPPEVLRDLPTSQSGDGRHKCAVCAYAAGYAAGQQAATCPVPLQLQALIELLETESSEPYREDVLLLDWLRRGLP